MLEPRSPPPRADGATKFAREMLQGSPSGTSRLRACFPINRVTRQRAFEHCRHQAQGALRGVVGDRSRLVHETIDLGTTYCHSCGELTRVGEGLGGRSDSV